MLQRSLILALLAVLGVACKGATNGKLPVDHPTYAYQPPEVEEDEEEDEDEDEVEDTEAEGEE